MDFNILPKKRTKLALSFLVFVFACVFLATGHIGEGSWVTMAQTVLAIYATTKVAQDYVRKEK